MALDHDRRLQIATAASNWRARMAEPDSAAEVEAFEVWLNEDPEHARAYATVDAISDAGAKLPRQMLHNPVADRRPPWLAWAKRPAFAASVAVGIAAIGGVWLASSGTKAAHAALSNDGPAIRAYRLADGSAVILDRQTALDITLRPTSREIALHKGRARFRVAPAANRPFTVVSGDTKVTAAGTLFDVARDGRETIVVVLAGRVLVSADRKDTGSPPEAALGAGEAADVKDGRIGKHGIDENMRRWPDGRVAFKATPLSDVVAYVNRRDGTQIALADAAVGRLTVTGVLDLRDTRALARKIAATFGLRTQDNQNAVTILR